MSWTPNFTSWFTSLRTSLLVGVLCSIAPAAAAGQGVVVGVGDPGIDSVVPGATVDIPIRVDMSRAGSLDLSRVRVRVTWTEPLITLASFAEGAGTEISRAVGELIAEATFAPATPSDFVLGTLTLSAEPSASTQRTRINVEILALEDGNVAEITDRGAGVPLELCVCAGGGVFGDVDGIPGVSPGDAQEILNRFLGRTVSDPALVDRLGDVDNTVGILPGDAQEVLNFFLGRPLSRTPTIIGTAAPPDGPAQTPTIVAFLTQPADVVIPESIVPLVLTVVDQSGHIVTDFAGDIEVSIGVDGAGGGTQLSGEAQIGTISLPVANGIAVFVDLSLDQPGPAFTLSADAAPGLGPEESASFDVVLGGGGDFTLTFLQPPTNAEVDQPIAPPVQVQVLDGGGDPVPIELVSLSLTGNPPGVNLTGGDPVPTDGQGLAAFPNLVVDQPGEFTLTATVGTQTLVSPPFLVTPGSVVTDVGVTFLQQPSDVDPNTDMAPPVRVQVQDDLGNPIPNANVWLELVAPLNPQSPAVLLGGGPVPTDPTGVATFPNLQVDLEGQFVLNAHVGSASATSDLFDVIVGGGGDLTLNFLQPPTNVEEDKLIAPAVQVQVLDGQANPVPIELVSLSLTGSPPGVNLTGGDPVPTDGQGITAFPNLVVDQPGEFTLTATVGTQTLVSPPFLVTPGSVVTDVGVTFLQQPSDADPNTDMAPPVRVQVQDDLGNPVPNANVRLELVDPLDPQSTAVFVGGGPLPTDPAGVAVFPNLRVDLEGQYVLNAHVGSAISVSDPFIVTDPTTTVQFIVQPTNVTRSALIDPAVVVEIRDGGGQPIVGQSIELALIDPSSTGATLSGTLDGVSDPSGQVIFDDLSVDLLGDYSLRVTSGPGSADSDPFMVVQTGLALAFTGQPQNAQTGAAIGSVSVEVLDAGQNPVPGLDVTLELSGLPTGVVLGGTNPVTTSGSGVGTFPDLTVDQPGSYRLTARVGSESVESDVFVITEGSVVSGANLTFQVQPSDGIQGQPVTPQIEVLVQTDAGDAVEGVPVMLEVVSPPSPGGADFGGVHVANSDANGVAAFPGQTLSPGGNYVLRAVAGSATRESDPFFIQGLSEVRSLEFIAQPGPAMTGQSMVPGPTLRLTDGLDAPVETELVSLSLVDPTGFGGQLANGDPIGTDGDGQAVFPTLQISQPGRYRLQGVAESTTRLSDPFDVGPALSPSLQFEGPPLDGEAGVILPQPVVVRVTDGADGNIESQPVTLRLTNPNGATLGGTLTVLSVTNGRAIFNDVTVSEPGRYTLTAESGTSTLESGSFDIIVTGTTIEFVQEPSNVTATVGIAPPISVRVLDGGGQPIEGQPIDLTLNDPNSTGAQFGEGSTLTGFSDATGVLVFDPVTVDLPGDYTLTATSGSATVESQNFMVTEGGLIVTFEQGPTNVQTGAAMLPDVQVRVTDGLLGPEEGLEVSLSLTGDPSGVTLSNAIPAITDANGQVTFAGLSVDVPGEYTLMASVGSTSGESTRFLVTDGSVVTDDGLSFQQQPSQVAPNVDMAPPVEVLVFDDLGGAVVGAPVRLHLTDPQGATLQGAGPVLTDAQGVAVFPGLRIDLENTYTLTAEVGSANTVSDPFVVVGPRAIEVLQHPLNVATNELITPGPRAELKTLQGNAVPGVDIAIEITGNPQGVNLAGSVMQTTDASGVVRFDDLSINTPGLYTFTLSTASETVETGQFLVTDGLPLTSIDWIQGPSDVLVNDPVVPSPSVRMESPFGPFVGIPVSLELTDPQGANLVVTAPILTDSDGIATFPDVRIDQPGTYTLTAVAGSERDERVIPSFRVLSTQEAANARLGDLRLTSPDTPLDQAFDPTASSYTATVVPGTSTITVVAVPEIESATVRINGVEVGGSGSLEVPLILNDVTSIPVEVVSFDGLVTQTYTIDVTRPPSSEARLGLIRLQGGSIPLTPEFDSDTKVYSTVTTTGSVGVAAFVLVGEATHTVNGIPGRLNPSSGVVIPTPPGQTTEIEIEVTAEDGVTTDLYRVRITRAQNNAELASLSLESPATPFDTPFSPDVVIYRAVLADGTVSTINVVASTSHPGASIEIDGSPVPDGAAQSVPLAGDAETVITVLVTAADGVTQRDYRITVFRPSENTTLNNLALTEPDTGLLPPFNPTIRDYSATVPSGTPSIMVTATRSDDRQNVVVNGTAIATSITLPLVVGDNPVSIEVTAPDGFTTGTYDVTVRRPANDDATLTNIELLNPATDLTPEFDSNTFSYNATVPFENQSVLLRVTPSDPAASMRVLGSPLPLEPNQVFGEVFLPLTAGENLRVPIQVVAIDGGTVENYDVTIRRAGNSAALFEINVEAPQASQGVLPFNQPFDPVVLSYVTDQPLAGTTTVLVSAGRFDPSATLTIDDVEVTFEGQQIPVALFSGTVNTVRLRVTSPDGQDSRAYNVLISTPTVSIRPIPEAITLFEIGAGFIGDAVLLDQNGDPAPIQPTDFDFTSLAGSVSVDPATDRIELVSRAAESTAIQVTSPEINGSIPIQDFMQVDIAQTFAIVPRTSDAPMIGPGQSLPFEIAVDGFNSDRNSQLPPVTWSSSDPSILSVDPATGVATASPTNVGTAVISASGFGLVSNNTTVTVGPTSVADIVILSGPAVGGTVNLDGGDGLGVRAQAVDQNGDPVPGVPIQWKSTDTDLVRVGRAVAPDFDPLFTRASVVAVQPGSATLSLSAGGVSKELYTVIVGDPPPPVDRISMVWSRLSLNTPVVLVPEGVEQFLRLSILDEFDNFIRGGADVVLESDNPLVVQVVSNPAEGASIVRAVGPGTATIRARSVGTGVVGNSITVTVFEGG